jgi:hypothetical protein
MIANDADRALILPLREKMADLQRGRPRALLFAYQWAKVVGVRLESKA